MKNKKNSVGRGASLSLLAVILFASSFKIANAQSSVTPGTPKSLIEGFTTVYSVIVKPGDTLKVWWEYSSDVIFSAPVALPSKTWTNDSSKVRDTFTVVKNSIPQPDSIVGYTHYIRLAMELNGVTTYVKPSLPVDVLPKPLKIKVQSFGITPLSGGCVVGFFGSTGSNFENAGVTFRFRYNSSDIWRKPNPDSVNLIGMSQSFSRTLTGMLSNKSITLWVKVKNTVSSWDTVVTFTTTPTSTKPVVAEAAGKSATSDSAFIKIEATSFNLSSKFYVINTTNNDTLIQTITSTKMETLTLRFGKVLPNTQYTFKVYGVNSMGTGNVVTITVTTQPKLATPTFTALKPDVRYDVAQGQYYILPKVDWVTNSGEKVKRIDVRIYTDSLYQSVPMVWKVSSEQSGLTGPLTGPRVDSDSGRFWYEYVVETTTEIFTSNLLGYDVKWAVVPKNTLGVSKMTLPNGPVQCKLYDMSGKLIHENWIVNPKVNLFSNELPIGVLISVTDGFIPFRVYNQGRG
jgi:hypothetical protein